MSIPDNQSLMLPVLETASNHEASKGSDGVLATASTYSSRVVALSARVGKAREPWQSNPGNPY